jgi:hypothetical protein
VSISQLPHRPADVAPSGQGGAVIVMAYTGSGAGRLRSAMSAFPGVTCTGGTGILPLCHTAVTTWQTVDGRESGVVSPLAASSARTLSAALVAAILARDGGRRWCEFTTAPQAAAETFARLYPQTRFLIVHRRADTTVRTILGGSRWGISGSEFAPFVAAHPASSLAALVSYWATCTAQQLDFERAHHESCLRVRVEDLTAHSAQTLQDIGEFLDLDEPVASPWLVPGNHGSGPADADPPATGLPLALIQAPMRAQLNDLHHILGYPPITNAEA